MNISQIRDYVEQDKPIAGTVAKDWLRYLLQERDDYREVLEWYALVQLEGARAVINKYKEESK